jgi:hypothetical protein
MAMQGVKSELYGAPPSHPWNILSADTTNPAVTKKGSWASVIDTSAMGLAYIQSKTAGDTLQLTFVGVGLWVWVRFGPDCGQANIQIDNDTPITLDFYSASARKDILWPAVSLDKLGDDGKLKQHTCLITVLGTTTGSDSYVRIDGFERELDLGALQTRTIIEQIVTTKLSEILGRTDYVPMLEVAPWTGQYKASPTAVADQVWGAILADNRLRAIVGIHPLVGVQTPTISRDAQGNITSMVQTFQGQTLTTTFTRDAAGNCTAISKAISG